MASDVAPAPLVAQLQELRRERDELGQSTATARDQLRLLERERPAWYRFRARSEHALASERATSTVRRMDRAVLKLNARENELLEQLARERAGQHAPRVRDRVARSRERGRGMGRGL